MKCLLLFLVCGFLGFQVPAHGEVRGGSEARPVIIVGGDQNYPPFEFLDKAGRPAGFDVELTQAIAEVMGLQVEIRLADWNEMRRSLEGGSVDVMEGVSLSSERSKIFDYSAPHCIVRQSIFARRGSTPVLSLEDLRGKAVAVQRGGIMHDSLAESQVGANLILVDTHAAALRMVASGKSDYAIVNTLTGLYFGLELGLSNIVPVGQPVAEIPYGYAVKKGNTRLLGEFNQGLTILRNTGRYQQIYDKWLGILESQPSPWRKVIKYGSMVLIPMLALIGVIAAWSWSLRKKIAEYIKDSEIRQQELIQADKLASLGILVSGVAHEINNPTGLILYNLPILRSAYQVTEAGLEARYAENGDFMIGGLSYGQLREEIPRLFDEMQGGARRIKRIVDDLKDFARKDTSSLDEAVDLNAVVQTAVRLLATTIKKSTRQFQVSCGDRLPLFRGNPQRIEQVVVNLVLNACQALPGPDQGIQLATSFDEQRGEVRLAVKDEGVGIPPEHLAHLTDPFFTTRRASGGTGLGLSVSAGIVKDHHGKLEFDSEPGVGTTAVMTLPAMKRNPRHD
jgi:polar amino acid transport system substrate-binding protein